MSTPILVRSFASAFSATLVLTACGPAAEAPAEAPAPDAAGAAGAAPEATTDRWETIAGPDGVALALIGPAASRPFHIACRTGPVRLSVLVEAFEPVSSEDRLTLGVDGEAFALAADLSRQEPGVSAEGALDPVLLSRLERTPTLSAVYGAQQAGPWPAPEAATLTAFVEGCRTIRQGALSEPAA